MRMFLARFFVSFAIVDIAPKPIYVKKRTAEALYTPTYPVKDCGYVIEDGRNLASSHEGKGQKNGFRGCM